MSYYKSFELPAVILRPFNNFGPRQSNRAVIPTIINQALKSNCKEIKIGSVKPTRDFLFIDDNINLIYLINKQKVKGEVYNVGTGVEISINELINRVLKILNKKNIKIMNQSVRNRPKTSEVLRLVCNATKNKKSLNGNQV